MKAQSGYFSCYRTLFNTGIMGNYLYSFRFLFSRRAHVGSIKVAPVASFFRSLMGSSVGDQVRGEDYLWQ